MIRFILAIFTLWRAGFVWGYEKSGNDGMRWWSFRSYRSQMKSRCFFSVLTLLALMPQVVLSAGLDNREDNCKLPSVGRMVSMYESAATKISPEEDKRLSVVQQVIAAYGGAVVGTILGVNVAPPILIGDKEADPLGIGIYLSVLIGEIIGASVGSSGMLYLADRSSSFWWMLAAGAVPAIGLTILSISSCREPWVPLCLAGLVPPAGAIIAYNLTTHRGRGENQSLLEISGHRLTTSVPTPYIGIEQKGLSPLIEYRIDILAVHF